MNTPTNKPSAGMAFECSLCDSIAGGVMYFENKENQAGSNTPFLLVKGSTSDRNIYHLVDVMMVDDDLNKVKHEELIKMIKEKDLNKIISINSEWVSFFCFDCDQPYCRDHWEIDVTHDDTFYDASYGTCPKGHRKKLDD